MLHFRGDVTPLERYTHNLTKLAQQGAFAPLIGQEAVIDRVFHVLQRKNKCNPVILDRDGSQRWAVVAEVIRRMVVGDYDAPDPFSTWQVITLNYEALFTNLSDDTLNRQQHREQMIAPLVEKLSQVEPDSEEAWAVLNDIFR